MRTKWVKGKHGLPELRYAVKYDATVKRKGLFGIPYKTTERCVSRVNWKTYKRIKYKPYSIEEMMFYLSGKMDDVGLLEAHSFLWALWQI